MYSIYTAFVNNLKYIGEKEYDMVFKEYEHRKEIACRSRYLPTFVGIIPWLYQYLLLQHNIHSSNHIEMKIERSYLPLTEYMLEAVGGQQNLMVENTRYWGDEVENISLSPAIYCLLNEQVAIFDTKIPSHDGARILMAIQFLKMEHNHGIKISD